MHPTLPLHLTDAFVATYQAALARYVSTDDPLTREYALHEATEMGKSLIAGSDPSIDDLRETHRQAMQSLVGAWRTAADGSTERAALDRLDRGDGSTFGIAFLLPQELEQSRLHEQRWRREHGKLLALFDQTDDLIVVLDAQGQIESVNPAFTRKTGWSTMEAIIRAAAMWHGPLPTEATRRLRNDLARRDGSVFRAEWSISPIFDQYDALLCHVCIGRDVTFQQQIDDTVRENDKLRAIATLAGGIAHDFNNLLGSILGLTELCALDAPEGSRQARNLERIGQAGDKAAALVRQMLDFSRQTPSTLLPTKITAWFAHAEGLLQAAVPRHHTLTLTVEEDATLRIDLVQMEQVLLNMVRNAAQALGERYGQVRIVADRVEPAARQRSASGRGHARIRVIDNGAGIAHDVLGMIFEPFFTTKPIGEGTGLGLAAVHGIVTAHGGTLEVSSELNMGTCFNIYLPLCEPPDIPFAMAAGALTALSAPS